MTAEQTYENALKAFNEKDFKLSKLLCNKAIELNPADAAAANLLGSIYVQERDFQTARKLFLRAYELKPNAFTAFNLAEMEYVERKWGAAQDSFEKIVSREDAKDNYKNIARFRLVVVALKLRNKELYEKQRGFFEKNGLDMELDFTNAVTEIHAKNLNKEAAARILRPLKKKHEKAGPYIDGILEAYSL